MNLNYNISIKDPQPEFVSLQHAKNHLKIDFIYEDALIQGMIDSAIDTAENYLGWFIKNRDVVINSNAFLNYFALEFGPLLGSAFTVKYLNKNNVLQTLIEGYTYQEFYGAKPVFYYDSDIPFPEVGKKSNTVQISYVAGVDLTTIPKPVYQAILLIISDLYEFRTDRAEIINTRAMALMRPYKKFT
ncbi:head-tail connector protein [Aquimarina sp. Aq78]|uniref:head-tail connector protein n=1 Tax=Aquimarina sp. Aq78 TaxID=1191889 RepID=UPI000D0EF9DD|nr:head-tail connector protein [Aquimarina sp. Aq78]